ncbi:hypothetical protein ElyMa_004579000 [Elysia marginata]|uniref:Uncharacterized protein n=1 Tax=Elysia marginata TaxID=1093978 RepID=A0AAV4HUU5_9GAST|nr:hypothetical protein ElyMa_004579000 [Elysia marginata]
MDESSRSRRHLHRSGDAQTAVEEQSLAVDRRTACEKIADGLSASDRLQQMQENSATPNSAGGHPVQVIGVAHPDPLYDLHLHTPRDLTDASSAAGRYRNRVNVPGMRSTTSSLPRFLPDGHKRFIPDPRLLPGDTDIRVLEGSKAVLPCTVQYLGARQVGTHFTLIYESLQVDPLGRDRLGKVKNNVWT